MAKQRMINTRFWTDGYIYALTPMEKFMFLYLLTNSHTDICGIYEIPIKVIASDTGVKESIIVKMLDKFEKDGKILYINGWVAVKNFEKHQLDNPKVKRGIQLCYERAPRDILDRLFSTADRLS